MPEFVFMWRYQPGQHAVLQRDCDGDYRVFLVGDDSSKLRVRPR